jgi:hypothetical protein
MGRSVIPVRSPETMEPNWPAMPSRNGRKIERSSGTTSHPAIQIARGLIAKIGLSLRYALTLKLDHPSGADHYHKPGNSIVTAA